MRKSANKFEGNKPSHQCIGVEGKNNNQGDIDPFRNLFLTGLVCCRKMILHTKVNYGEKGGAENLNCQDLFTNKNKMQKKLKSLTFFS
ncbi:hypothetical protein KKC91_01125 [bacterium]|nr:hypothetical protein [bacterium]